MKGFTALALAVGSQMAFCSGMKGDPSVPKSLWDIEVKTLEGEPFKFADYKNKAAFLITNVASKCGYTDQGYEQLSQLAEDYEGDGLVILGVPCNQFGGQEPGTAKDILSFAKQKEASFLLLEKMEVNGENAHPLYKFLKGEHIKANDCKDEDDNCDAWAEQGECESNPDYMSSKCPLSCGECDPTYEFFGELKWNFESFLVDPDGEVLERFKTGTDLLSDDVADAIDLALEGLEGGDEEDGYGEEDEDNYHEEL